MSAEKYIAVKVRGLNHWLWFQKDKIEQDDSVRFLAKGGWGKGGAFTEINVEATEIVGRIASDTLQYS